MWKLIDSASQIYERTPTQKDVSYTCWMNFSKKLSSDC